MTKQQNTLKIEANPTKDLFINMLVKDITLKDAIGDLVDNSVDGARSNTQDKKDLSQFFIKILAGEDLFVIEDNCGGIESKTAREHAFRFGRPETYTPTPGSIGQFGIGMKRAFFKIGRDIEIKSKASTSDFFLKIDVLKWRKDEKKWFFEFNELNENVKHELKDTGTKISVSSLTEEAKSLINDKKFINDLISEISLEQMLNINRGLKISINGSILTAPAITLQQSEDLKPYFFTHTFPSSLTVRILAGVSEDNSEDGGWYVFCNDRLIMGRDRSVDTGWTGKYGDGVAEYHDQFYRFRGYAFFYADDVSKLPWNTTKTNMNVDSPEYKFVRSKMIEAMKLIMTLLNKLKQEKEKGNPTVNQVLNNRINDIVPVPVANILTDTSTLNNKFQFPQIASAPPKSTETIISYKISNEKFKKAKDYLDVSKPADVGLMTFNYFFENEIG